MNLRNTYIVVVFLTTLTGCGHVQTATSTLQSVSGLIRTGKQTASDVKDVADTARDVMPGAQSSPSGMAALTTSVEDIEAWADTTSQAAPDASIHSDMLQVRTGIMSTKLALTSYQAYRDAGHSDGKIRSTFPVVVKNIRDGATELSQALNRFNTHHGKKYPELTGLSEKFEAARAGI